MRRKRADYKHPGPTEDIKKIMTVSQLAAVGAMAMAFNEAEANLDELVFAATALPPDLQLEVVTRFRGIDDRIAVAKAGAKSILCSQDFEQLTLTLGDLGLGNLKVYRDCVVHARFVSGPVSIGIRLNKKSDIYDVLLDQGTLNKAYNLLVSLAKELWEAASLVHGMRALTMLDSADPEREPLEARVQACQARFRASHTERLSLPPMPESISEPVLQEAAMQAHRETLETMLHWHYPYQARPQGRFLWKGPGMELSDTPLPLRMAAEAEAKKKAEEKK